MHALVGRMNNSINIWWTYTPATSRVHWCLKTCLNQKYQCLRSREFGVVAYLCFHDEIPFVASDQTN